MYDLLRLNVLEGKYPSCPQATLASALFHPSSHTEPHTLWTQISTLPIVGLLPPTSLMLPCVQLVTSTDWPSTINNCKIKITRITLLLYCKLRCVINSNEVLVSWLLLIRYLFCVGAYSSILYIDIANLYENLCKLACTLANNTCIRSLCACCGFSGSKGTIEQRSL